MRILLRRRPTTMMRSAACPTMVRFPRSRYTGKERDSESGNDYFGARYYASSMGRFMGPDHPFVDQHPDNPQSWNLYAYARNNPLILVDPNGLGCLNDLGRADATHESVSIGNSISSDGCAGQHGTWVPGDIDANNASACPCANGRVLQVSILRPGIGASPSQLLVALLQIITSPKRTIDPQRQNGTSLGSVCWLRPRSVTPRGGPPPLPPFRRRRMKANRLCRKISIVRIETKGLHHARRASCGKKQRIIVPRGSLAPPPELDAAAP